MAREETQESVKVLSTWASPFGMRLLIALHEKGVHFDYQEEDLANRSQLLLEANPIHKKVPVLLHNGKPICESLIIVQYIDEVWPSQVKSFLPSDPYQRALARFWADYIDKKIYDAGSRIIRSPKGERREQGKKDLKECLATLDGALRDVWGGGPYFGGEKINLVDIALAPFVSRFEAYETLGEFKLLEEEVCPHLFKWVKAIVEYPSVKRALSNAPSHKLVEYCHVLRKMSLGA